MEKPLTRRRLTVLAGTGLVAGLAGCSDGGENGTENGNGNETENGNGNETENGNGNETENGNGNETENGNGNETENGTGNETENGNGNETENGNGNETENGEENGGENGTENGGENGDPIESGTEIELEAAISGWIGVAPDMIADEENPTLTLTEGESYELGWREGDGMGHNIEVRDSDGEVIDDLSTEVSSEGGDDQFLEFEASSEMAEYVCNPHQGSMVGEIEIV